MRRRSLKQKLIIRNSITLVSLFLAFFASFIWIQNNQYQDRIREIRQEGERNLKDKGEALVRDKHITLRAHVQDLSRESIEELVSTNVDADDSIVLGTFIRKRGNQPWVWATQDYKSGKVMWGFEEVPKEIADSIAMDEQGRVFVTDKQLLTWAFNTDKYTAGKRFTSRAITSNGERNLADAAGVPEYEFAGAVYVSDDEDPGAREEFAGVIIYRLSPKETEKQINDAKKSYQSQQTTTTLIMILLGLVALAMGFYFTQRQAATITQPLNTLTSAAASISEGDYSIAVQVSSGDEVETLASSFNQMVKDLERTYADLRTRNRQLEDARRELEDLNRHLEEKVVERTKQLAESESKFRTLFEESADAIALGSKDSFFDCNPAMLEMMGCKSKAEFLTLSPDDISPEIQPDGARSDERIHDFFRLARNAGSQHFEWQNRRLNGELFPTEIVVTSFPLNGQQVLHMVFRDISERKQTEEKLRRTQQKLVETAHSAGMAEIATGVLHNIGNILNSVNISTEEIANTLKSSKIRGFLRANELLQENIDKLAEFFTEHPKGKLIPGYYINLGEAIKDEHLILNDEIRSLTEKVSMMRDVISTQQNYAKATLYTEDVQVTDLVEDALKLQIASLRKQGVRVNKEYDYNPRGMVPKVKLVHVLTNLIKNGKEAMNRNESENRSQEMNIAVREGKENLIEISVTDNGCGINAENLDKIFNHGFTTKTNGHGFGLHTCANFMTEMGGSLTAESKGPGTGSTFTLRFPMQIKGERVDAV